MSTEIYPDSENHWCWVIKDDTGVYHVHADIFDNEVSFTSTLLDDSAEDAHDYPDLYKYLPAVETRNGEVISTATTRWGELYARGWTKQECHDGKKQGWDKLLPNEDLIDLGICPIRVINPDGSVRREEWYQQDELSRVDGPAYVEYYPDGSIKHTANYLDGEHTSSSEPTDIFYRPDGSIKSEAWFQDGELHRDDGPAVTTYREDGSIEFEIWYQDGQWHRDEGPARIKYYEDGSIAREEWWQDGVLHREGGSAITNYYRGGSVKSKAWYQDGELHRDGGSASTYYREDGTVESEHWYQDGVEVPQPQPPVEETSKGVEL